MAPPKSRLHNKTGKLKTLNKTTITSSNEEPQARQTLAESPPQQTDPEPGPSTLSTNNDEQFELELCWCIQTLETSLATGKLNAKQGKNGPLIERHP